MSKEEKEGLIEEHILYNDGEDRFLASAGGYNDWPVSLSILLLLHQLIIISLLNFLKKFIKLIIY